MRHKKAGEGTIRRPVSSALAFFLRFMLLLCRLSEMAATTRQRSAPRNRVRPEKGGKETIRRPVSSALFFCASCCCSAGSVKWRQPRASARRQGTERDLRKRAREPFDGQCRLPYFLRFMLLLCRISEMAATTPLTSQDVALATPRQSAGGDARKSGGNIPVGAAQLLQRLVDNSQRGGDKT